MPVEEVGSTDKVVSLPLQMVVVPAMSPRATAGAFTVTSKLLVSVAVQVTSLVLTVAVATTVYSVVASGVTVMLLLLPPTVSFPAVHA